MNIKESKKEDKKILTISIPTKNKDLLKYNIEQSLELLKNRSVSILICDNSEDDEIEKIYKKIKKEYQNIYYKKNTKEKNYDMNCFNALKIPNTKYVWAIGDGLIVRKERIMEVLEILKEGYDIIVFDYLERIKKEKIKKYYSNNSEFFKDLCWHITLLGSTIFKKELIESSLEKCYLKYMDTYFMHLGILLESISNQNFKAIIIKEGVCKNNPLKKSSTWSSLTFKTFCDGWIKFIGLLPDVYIKQKEYVIKSHGVKSGLFTVKIFVFLRAKYNEYSIKNIYINRKNLKRVTNVPICILYLIWLIPKCFLNIPINTYQKIRRRTDCE